MKAAAGASGGDVVSDGDGGSLALLVRLGTVGVSLPRFGINASK